MRSTQKSRCKRKCTYSSVASLTESNTEKASIEERYCSGLCEQTMADLRAGTAMGDTSHLRSYGIDALRALGDDITDYQVVGDSELTWQKTKRRKTV